MSCKFVHIVSTNVFNLTVSLMLTIIGTNLSMARASFVGKQKRQKDFIFPAGQTTAAKAVRVHGGIFQSYLFKFPSAVVQDIKLYICNI